MKALKKIDNYGMYKDEFGYYVAFTEYPDEVLGRFTHEEDFMSAVDAVEEEMRVLMAEAKAEFGF